MSIIDHYTANTYAAEFKSSPLLSLKNKCTADLNSIELPHRRNEIWKYTNLDKTLENNFTHQEAASSIEVLDTNDSFSRLVFIDGVFNSALSDKIDLEIQALTETTNDLSEFSDTLESDFLSVMNLANLGMGNIIRIKKNQSFEKPILIDSYFSGSGAQRHITNFIIAENFSKAEFLERININKEDDVFVNSRTHFELKECANLHYATLQTANANSFVGITHKSILEKDSYINTVAINLGASLSRTNLYSKLIGKNATSDMHGLYALKDKQHHDTYSYTQHDSGETYAHQLYKGILSDNSRGVFTGKIRIEKDAQLVAAEQLNRNLLLSKKAYANSRPQLEIYADDVKCAHGSTTGQISDDELFYFQARGVTKERAQKILAKAFAHEVVFKIENNDIRKLIISELEKREIV